MAIDANLKCNTFNCSMQLSYCTTQCGYAGRNGKQCGDLAKYIAEEPDKAKAIVADVLAQPNGSLSNAFKVAFPAMLPDGTPVPAPKLRPSERMKSVKPPGTSAVPIDDLPKAVDFLAKLPGYEPAKPEPDEDCDTQSPPVTEQVTEQVTVQVPAVTVPTEKPRKKTENKPMNIPSVSTEAPLHLGVGTGPMTIGISSGTSVTNAPPPNKAITPTPSRRKKVLPNISGMNFFLETERDSNIFILLPINTSSDAMMALTGGDPKRRLILATGVTYEFQINNLGNDAGAQ